MKKLKCKCIDVFRATRSWEETSCLPKRELLTVLPLTVFCYWSSCCFVVITQRTCRDSWISEFFHLLIYLGRYHWAAASRWASCCNEARSMRPGGCAQINTDMQDPQSLPLFFFSLLYKRQNSLNKGKQITPQVGMFITQVAWGHRQLEGNIYIHVSTPETGLHNSTLINSFFFKKKLCSCIFLLMFRHSRGFWESFFWIGPPS